jgi:hypothetical protein
MSSLHIVNGKRRSNGLRQRVEIAKEEKDTWGGRMKEGSPEAYKPRHL